MRNAKFLSCNQQVNNTIVNEAKWKKLLWISQYTKQLQAPCYHDYEAMDGRKRTISFAFTLNYNIQETAVIWK
jgi:hypothetical protein